MKLVGHFTRQWKERDWLDGGWLPEAEAAYREALQELRRRLAVEQPQVYESDVADDAQQLWGMC